MTTKKYNPTPEILKKQHERYDALNDMWEIKNRSYSQFNGPKGDRNLTQYVDAMDKRLNGYTPTREDQDKESWQSNIHDNTTRNKLKAIVATISTSIPEMTYQAVSKTGIYSAKRAELVKQLVRHSRLVGQNPQLDMFFEAWECAGKGTVVKYDGYLLSRFKRKFIKSFDLTTGESEFSEREEVVDDRPIDLHVPLAEFFIDDIYTPNVQDQRRLAWVQHYNKSQIEQEFGHYRNTKYVLDRQGAKKFQDTNDTFYYKQWGRRVSDEDDYEVFRFYSKEEDVYEIWINGIDILYAPLLWGGSKKLYPFSKTIFEPFDGFKFFYGKALPHILEGYQDTRNTLINSILDKTYRAISPPMLVGLVNKDLLDIEDEFVNQDNKIYVPDINQVKPMPYEGMSQSEVAMLEVVARSMDLASVDVSQQGATGKGVTAREIVIADERAKELKGTFYMFLEDLWLQKTRLRIQNILLNYTEPKIERVVGKDGKGMLVEAFQLFQVPDTEFSDGSVGTLGIQVVSAGSKRDKLAESGVKPQKQLSVREIEARELQANKEGINLKLVSVSSDYLDNWEFDFTIVPQSIQARNQIRKEAVVKDKLQSMAVLFPEYLASNKEKAFSDFLDIYGESAEEYAPPAQQPPPMEEGQTPQVNVPQNAPRQ